LAISVNICVANCSRSIGSTLARQSSITDDLTMGILCPLFVSQPVTVLLTLGSRFTNSKSTKKKKKRLVRLPLDIVLVLGMAVIYHRVAAGHAAEVSIAR
jgi:hypothetical protein